MMKKTTEILKMIGSALMLILSFLPIFSKSFSHPIAGSDMVGETVVHYSMLELCSELYTPFFVITFLVGLAITVILAILNMTRIRSRKKVLIGNIALLITIGIFAFALIVPSIFGNYLHF